MSDLLIQLNFLDMVIIVIVLFSMLIGLLRGFVKEVLSLANWFLAYFIARFFAPNLDIMLAQSGVLVNSPYRSLLAYAFLFIATIIVGGILVRLVAAAVHNSILAPASRLLGMLFGLSRGVVIIAVVIVIANWSGLVADTLLWKTSVVLPYFLELEAWFKETLMSSPVSV